MELAGIADSPLTAQRRARAAALKGGGAKARRTRVTNGRTLLPTAVGNSIWARIARDTLASLIAHLGGTDMISETQRLIARRVSMLEAELIFMEDVIGIVRAEGREPDPIADERPLVFCATCGVTFIERNSLTKSSAS
jgi:hypothetical protein